MNYVRICELGKGGFGVVDEVSGEDNLIYARKTLVVPPLLDAKTVRPRFEREVRYQSAIKHPNVVQIIHSDLDADPPWFIMYKALCSLQDELEQDRTLGGDPKKALFDILAGLEEIHRRGYLHRDLKPGNVLKFAYQDGTSAYALSDFGLMAVGEDASSTLTPSGIGGGTPRYQAPECAINFHRATPRSDIYSFGAVLHDIFAVNPKRLPHEELTGPGDIGKVIEKCTKRNAHRRYRDVKELREALFEALSTHAFHFASTEEAEVVGLLTNPSAFPSPEDWDRIFDFLDANDVHSQVGTNVFRALRRDHIEKLGADDPDLAIALGGLYADHCRRGTFSFDYCDVLASKAQLFYDLGDVALKAKTAVAMMRLGTSHNRWFVENMFLRMASPNVESEVAERIAVELEVLGINFKYEFNHLSVSVRAQQSQLHPILQAKLI